MPIQENIPLFPFTTLKLGGSARYFLSCKTQSDVHIGLDFAKEKGIPFWILGGGSNTIIPDDGYQGLIIKIDTKGIQERELGDFVQISVEAGMSWDQFVEQTIKQGLTGIECLSGIPGTVGASPIQNIGAYGQEVSNTIESVTALGPDRKIYEFSREECGFSYRNSAFKSGAFQKFIVLSVHFLLSKVEPICVKYPEVENAWSARKKERPVTQSRLEDLEEFRNLILSLRKAKSMVLDPSDPNTMSVGSYFTNPILSPESLERLMNRFQELNLNPPNLFKDADGYTKISAAWLLEQSGITKGLSYKSVGVSTKHCLALVNRGGTTRELLELEEIVRMQVQTKFGIRLEREPVLLKS